MDPQNTSEVTLEQIFPRIQKRALAVALGVTCGGFVFLLTAFHVIVQPAGIPLYLLAQFFHGYTVTWVGAFVGLAWGFAAGFVAGGLLGFVHNATLGIWSAVLQARADLSQKRDVLDQIR